MMPEHRGSVGIQLFATITSKDHYTSLQRDLVSLASCPTLQDTMLHCQDGRLHLSRLLVGLILPDLPRIPSFSTTPELTILLPQHRRAELEILVSALLSPPRHIEDSGGDMMTEWTDAIDTIIDNLEPEKESQPDSGRVRSSATLHSSLTRENAVLHSAQEDEHYTDSVLVVAEDSSQEQSDHSSNRRRLAPGIAGGVARVSGASGVPGVPGVPGVHGVAGVSTPLLTVPTPRPSMLAVRKQEQGLQLPAQPPPVQPIQPIPPAVQSTVIPSHRTDSDVQILPSPRKPVRPKLVFSCPVCHQQFRAQDVMEEHAKIHSDKHKCHTCGLVCTKARELIEHQRVHSGARLIKCNVCEKDFTEKGLKLHTDRFHKIEKHAMAHNRTNKDSVNYMEDKISFTSSSDSDPDEVEEPKVKVAKLKRTELCELCEKYFTKKGIKLHISRYHQEDPEREAEKKAKKERKKNPPLKKLFTCGFCEKKFSHLASMKVHEKVHLGGKPHQCDMCEAKFSNKFDLFAHEKTHADARPHKCDECSETFKTAESLRFHKLIHVESQPNICRFCKKCFKNHNQLDLHERVHTGEKPFKCTHCEQCYETASKLTRHITSTHMS